MKFMGLTIDDRDAWPEALLQYVIVKHPDMHVAIAWLRSCEYVDVPVLVRMQVIAAARSA